MDWRCISLRVSSRGMVYFLVGRIALGRIAVGRIAWYQAPILSRGASISLSLDADSANWNHLPEETGIIAVLTQSWFKGYRASFLISTGMPATIKYT